jgi:hypothetical protein
MIVWTDLFWPLAILYTGIEHGARRAWRWRPT